VSEAQRTRSSFDLHFPCPCFAKVFVRASLGPAHFNMIYPNNSQFFKDTEGCMFRTLAFWRDPRPSGVGTPRNPRPSPLDLPFALLAPQESSQNVVRDSMEKTKVWVGGRAEGSMSNKSLSARDTSDPDCGLTLIGNVRISVCFTRTPVRRNHVFFFLWCGSDIHAYICVSYMYVWMYVCMYVCTCIYYFCVSLYFCLSLSVGLVFSLSPIPPPTFSGWA
jgi:hypothetical protein